MPIFLEPDQKFPIVLASDKDKPIESRPTFFAKSQSMRGQSRIASTLDRLREDGITQEQLFSDMIETLATVLTGWKNMNDIPFSKDALQDVLSYSEARELLVGTMYNQHVTIEEKKSSE